MIFFARWTPAIYWSLVSKPVSQDIQSICYCLHTGIFRLDTCDLVVAGVPISISSKYLYLYLALKVLTKVPRAKQRLKWCFTVHFRNFQWLEGAWSVADPRGCPCMDQNFLNFMQFLGKFVCWHLPLKGWCPLLWGNLDPPLMIISYPWMSDNMWLQV